MEEQLFNHIKNNNISVDIITAGQAAYGQYIHPERGPKSEPFFILKPHDEIALQQIILALNQFKISVVIFAGNTGLVSAQCAKNQAVLDLNFLDNLNSISFADKLFEFSKLPQSFSNAKKAEIWQDEFYKFVKENNYSTADFKNAAVQAQAGCSVGSINFVLEPAQIEIPIDTGAVYFGAGMSVGAGAANASHGTYGLMHGKMSDLVLEANSINGNGTLRQEVFDSNKKITIPEDKTIINSARAQYGDSALGTQGTFAVITNLKIKTTQKPIQQHLFYILCDDISQINSLRKLLHKNYPQNLRQFEIMSNFATEIVKNYEPDNFINPFNFGKSYNSKYIIMAEFITSELASKLGEIVFEFLTAQAKLPEDKIAYAAIDGENIIGDFEKFRKMRHAISGASTKYANSLGGANNHRITPDLSVPLNNLEAYIKQLEESFTQQNCEVNIFGHIGIGSLHVHIYSKTPLDKTNASGQTLKHDLTELAYKITNQHNGSCWSEHGIGTANAKLYTKYTQTEFVTEWLEYKRKHDPNNILNPLSNNFAELMQN